MKFMKLRRNYGFLIIQIIFSSRDIFLSALLQTKKMLLLETTYENLAANRVPSSQSRQYIQRCVPNFDSVNSEYLLSPFSTFGEQIKIKITTQIVLTKHITALPLTLLIRKCNIVTFRYHSKKSDCKGNDVTNNALLVNSMCSNIINIIASYSTM